MFKAISILCLALAPMGASAEELPLRDPLRPYTATQQSGPIGTASPQRIELQAVVVSSERRIAVINDELRREGENIDGAVIVKIERGAVHMRRAGEDFVLRLDRRSGSQMNRGDATP